MYEIYLTHRSASQNNLQSPIVGAQVPIYSWYNESKISLGTFFFSALKPFVIFVCCPRQITCNSVTPSLFMPSIDAYRLQYFQKKHSVSMTNFCPYMQDKLYQPATYSCQHATCMSTCNIIIWRWNCNINMVTCEIITLHAIVVCQNNCSLLT